MPNTLPLPYNPTNVVMETTESLPFAFDFTPLLLPTETIQSVSADFYNITVNPATPVTLTDSATFSGNIVTQYIRGSELTATQVFRLRVSATVLTGPPAKTWTYVCTIYCPS